MLQCFSPFLSLFYTSMFFSFLSSCFNVFFFFSSSFFHPNFFHFSFPFPLKFFLSPIFFPFSYLHYTMIHSLTPFPPHYSLPSASLPSPSSSSLSSPSLPSSAAFSFPLHMDPPPPAFLCIEPPTRPKCPKASVNTSTASASHSYPTSCFSVILSQSSRSLRSAHHNS